MKNWDNILSPGCSGWAIMIRLMLAGVFISEGYLKLVDPAWLGAGRFASIGIPWPSFTGPLVGLTEMACGFFMALGLFSRIAAIPLIIIMIVAIISTKIPIFLGHELWIFSLRKLEHYGFFSMIHESRLDYSMLLGAIFVLLTGSGRWSIDGMFFTELDNEKNKTPKQQA